MTPRMDLHTPHIRNLEDQLLAMREEQIRDRAVIAQALNVQRLRRIASTSHSPFAKQDWYAAEDALDDMLDKIGGDPRFRVRPETAAAVSSIGPYTLATFPDPHDPYPAVPLDLYRAEGGDE